MTPKELWINALDDAWTTVRATRVYRDWAEAYPQDARKIATYWATGKNYPLSLTTGFALSWRKVATVRWSLAEAAVTTPPILDLGAFRGRGFFASSPRQGWTLEKLDAMKASGFEYLVIDVTGTDSIAEWSSQGWLSKAKALGIRIIPNMWVDSVGSVTRLGWATAFLGSTGAVLNHESVAKIAPATVAAAVKTTAGLDGVDCLVLGEPWLQNDAGWDAYTNVVRNGRMILSPECYLNAKPIWTPRVCLEHARLEGKTQNVLATIGAGIWGDAPLPVTIADYVAGGLDKNNYMVYLLDSVPPTKIKEWVA